MLLRSSACSTVIYGWHIQYLAVASIVTPTKMIQCHSLCAAIIMTTQNKINDDRCCCSFVYSFCRSFLFAKILCVFFFTFFSLGHDNETMARISKALAIWVELSRAAIRDDDHMVGIVLVLIKTLYFHNHRTIKRHCCKVLFLILLLLCCCFFCLVHCWKTNKIFQRQANWLQKSSKT